MNVVMDTSVTVAWYLNEPCSKAARQWQDRVVSGKVHAMVPALHYLEFANVLRTYVRRRALDEATAQEIYSLHLEAPLSLAEPDRASILDIALRYNATVYDALYIALSLELQSPLLTAERPSSPWIKKLGNLADCLHR